MIVISHKLIRSQRGRVLSAIDPHTKNVNDNRKDSADAKLYSLLSSSPPDRYYNNTLSNRLRPANNSHNAHTNNKSPRPAPKVVKRKIQNNKKAVNGGALPIKGDSEGPPVPNKKKKSKVRVVKFSQSVRTLMAPSPFLKEPVLIKKRGKSAVVSSQLARSLRTNSSLMITRHHSVGKPCKVKVFVHHSNKGTMPSTPLKPLRLDVTRPLPVESFIMRIIEAFNKKYKSSALIPTSSRYELRMVDDDDGTPDTDMPGQ